MGLSGEREITVKQSKVDRASGTFYGILRKNYLNMDKRRRIIPNKQKIRSLFENEKVIGIGYIWIFFTDILLALVYGYEYNNHR